MKSYKNFCRLFFGMAALCVVALVASCSNVSDASVFDKQKNARTLNIAVSNYDDVVSSSGNASSGNRSVVSSENGKNSARTIIPVSYDSDGVDFYLYGTATNGKTFGPEKVDFTGKTEPAVGTSKTIGTIDVPADSYVWEFTLAALETGEAAPADLNDMKDNAVLIGYSSMDMVNGDTAKFTLSPDGLEKEASVAMKLYLDNWTNVPDGYKASAGIYKLTDGSVVNDSSAVPATTEKELYIDINDAADGFPKTAPAAANYSVTEMAPGTWLFKVTFENTATHKKFIWSDILIILPGKAVENEVAIPNVIGELPNVPSDFKAGYVDASEDKYNGYYVTEFSWTRDTLKNENSFEIDVLELAEATTAVPANDADWTTAVAAGTSKTFDDKFSSAVEHESGSLLACNETVQIRLELGNRYFARIRAVNDAGASDYAYVEIGAGKTTANGKEFTSDTINRYRITYHLEDGKFNGTVEGTDYTNEEDDIVVYYCQEKAAGNAIVQPNGTPNPSLVYDPDGTGTVEYDWTCWKKGGSKYDVTVNLDYPAYKDYKNLDLHAAYTTAAGVEIFDKSSYEINSGWIVLGTGGTFTPGKNGGTAEIDTAGITEIEWTFTPADVKKPDGSAFMDFAYDIVNFTLSRGGRTYYVTSGNNIGPGGTAPNGNTAFTVKMPLDGLSSGVYNVNFTARYKTTTVNYTITATVKR